MDEMYEITVTNADGTEDKIGPLNGKQVQEYVMGIDHDNYSVQNL